MTVHGREDLINRLSRSQAPITLLEGDSGAGKSTILAAAQDRTEGIAPPPQTLTSSVGVLQRALLDALGAATAQIIEEKGDAAVIADRLSQAAKNLARDRAQGLAIAVGKELLGVVQARLGTGFGTAVGDYVKELAAVGDETLAARISAATDPGVVDLLTEFCAEVHALGDERFLAIALDAGERLGDADIRILADLEGALPDGVHVRIAMATHTDTGRRRVTTLKANAAGLAVMEVEGLDEEAIAEWLSAEDLDPGLAPDVRRATSGYGLHLTDMIAHLKNGGDVEDAPHNQLFAERTREAWDDLQTSAKTHVRNLAVFGDPLPEERTEAFLGLTSAERAQLEEDLLRSRIFSDHVNGRPWFHEQRRQMIVRDILQPGERATASARAVDELLELSQVSNSLARVPEIAALVPAAAPLLENDERLQAVVELDRAELAVAAALIELSDPEQPVIDGAALLAYARRTFSGDGLVEALKRLEQRDLVVVQEQGDASAVVANWGSELAMVTASGRAALELDRMPIPSIARAVFAQQAMARTKSQAFTFGVGRPSATELSEAITVLRRKMDGGDLVLGRPAGDNLLVRATYADRPLYGAAAFDSAERRDEALVALTDFSADVFGERLQITDVVRHPTNPVADRRFVLAAERLTGANFFTRVQLELDEPLAPQEFIKRKAEALRTIRALSGPEERLATGLDEGCGIAWFLEEAEDEEGYFMVQMNIRGGREGAHRLESMPALEGDDPYRFLRLAEEVGLSPAERITSITDSAGVSWKPADPVVEVIAGLQSGAAAFNAAQGRRKKVVTLEAAALEAQLTEAAQRATADAQALATIPVGDGSAEVVPQVSYLVAKLDQPAPGLVPGAYATGLYTSVPSPGGADEVHVVVLDPGATLAGGGHGRDALAATFDADMSQVRNITNSDLHHLISRLLGYSESALEFRLP